MHIDFVMGKSCGASHKKKQGSGADIEGPFTLTCTLYTLIIAAKLHPSLSKNTYRNRKEDWQ